MDTWLILYVTGFLTAYTIAELEKWEIITDSPIFGRAFLFLMSTIVWPVILVGLIVCKLIEVEARMIEKQGEKEEEEVVSKPIVSKSVKLQDLIKDMERK
jgi:lysylphosphatidylglycerol synthetase-like protein (DUF2156 family)